MEKVQFQLEATLPELKDLHEKGLFAKNEINQITKRRTGFETSLIRRQTRKEDFFKYAEYEINLERLRKVRWKRLRYHINPPPPSASTYSLPRRAAYILKRATIKFPGDLAVWLAYVEFASREGMRKVVLKGLNNALHHHPLSSTLYLLLSYHHLHPNSPFPGSSIPSTSKLNLPSAHADDEDDIEASRFSLEGTASARTNILLGLRMIPKSVDLWREYVKLELGWVEGLRRRWKVLGVNIEPKETNGVDPDVLTGGEGSFGPEGEDARKSILAGQLIIHAINSSLQAIQEEGGMEFRKSLLDLLRTYPSALRSKCLDVVYADLERISNQAGEEAAEARFVILTKELYDRPYDPERKDVAGVVLEGGELVDAIGKIGKEIRAVAKSGKGGEKWLDMAGQWLVEQMELCGENVDLRQYLFSILTTLTKPAYKPSPTILKLHIHHLPITLSEEEQAAIVTPHAAQHPSDPSLQREKLSLLVNTSSPEIIRKAFKESMKSCLKSNLSNEEKQDVTAIYTGYLEYEATESNSLKEVDGIYKRILRETLRQDHIPELHPTVLGSYYEYLLSRQPETTDSHISILEPIISTYSPSHEFYQCAFDIIATRSPNPEADLQKVYTRWRASSRSNNDKVGATLPWADWLLENGEGKKAYDAVDVMRREIRSDEAALAELEAGWIAVMEDVGGEDSESGEEGSEEDDQSMSEGESEDEDEGEDQDEDEDVNME